MHACTNTCVRVHNGAHARLGNYGEIPREIPREINTAYILDNASTHKYTVCMHAQTHTCIKQRTYISPDQRSPDQYTHVCMHAQTHTHTSHACTQVSPAHSAVVGSVPAHGNAVAQAHERAHQLRLLVGGHARKHCTTHQQLQGGGGGQSQDKNERPQVTPWPAL